MPLLETQNESFTVSTSRDTEMVVLVRQGGATNDTLPRSDNSNNR